MKPHVSNAIRQLAEAETKLGRVYCHYKPHELLDADPTSQLGAWRDGMVALRAARDAVFAMARRSLPGDLVHHSAGGYGRLIFPWFRGRWLIFLRGSKIFDLEHKRPTGPGLPRGFRVMDRQFHNCSATGVR